MTVSLQSRALSGFTHGFSLRTGGVSEGGFASLNLARGLGDDEELVAENHRILARDVGYVAGGLFEVSQVHGAHVRVVEASDEVRRVREEQADALVAPPGGVAVAVRTADCVPVLVADPKTGAVAAIHAGWRGRSRGLCAAVSSS